MFSVFIDAGFPSGLRELNLVRLLLTVVLYVCINMAAYSCSIYVIFI
jgi:hypothetical protein